MRVLPSIIGAIGLVVPVFVQMKGWVAFIFYMLGCILMIIGLVMPDPESSVEVWRRG